MRIITALILFLMISMIYAGESLYKSDLEEHKNRDINNLTNQIQWNESRFDNETYLFNNSHASKIIYTGINFMGVTLFETSKWSIEFGYNNAEKYNFKFYLNLLKWYIYIMIFVLLFPIIIPLLALIYLTYVGIIYCYKKFKK